MQLLTYFIHKFKFVTNCMEQSPSWEANWSSASQEIPRILWNPEVHYPLSRKPAACPHPEPDQSSPRSPSYFLNIHFNIIQPFIRRSCKWSFSLRFPQLNAVCTCPPSIRATCPANLSSSVDLSNNIWLGKQIMKLLAAQSSPVTCYLVRLGPQVSSSALCSRTHTSCATPAVGDTRLYIHTKQQSKLQLGVFLSL